MKWKSNVFCCEIYLFFLTSQLCILEIFLISFEIDQIKWFPICPGNVLTRQKQYTESNILIGHLNK